MSEEESMSNEEFIQMLRLLKRYASTEMDQFALIKFDTWRSKMYLNLSMCPPVEGTEDLYSDLSLLIASNE